MDTIRFLSQFRVGTGNYTEERERLFQDMTVKDIVREIKTQRNAAAATREWRRVTVAVGSVTTASESSCRSSARGAIRTACPEAAKQWHVLDVLVDQADQAGPPC